MVGEVTPEVFGLKTALPIVFEKLRDMDRM